MIDMELDLFIRVIARETDALLDKLLPRSEAPERNLYEAMRYSVFAGGKRLRPALFAATLAAFGLERKPLLPFAAALEMIHTYSLIHDDLPAMDNDDLRRGRPTCHKVYGEAIAILAGDALLTQSFYTMLQTPNHPARLRQAISLVADLAGCGGMVAGQAAEFATGGLRHDKQLLDYINQHKTGGLFAASVLSAAILAGADAGQLESLERFSYQAGLAFQIVDDVLDVQGDEAQLGKPVGSDARNDKATYPLLLGCEAAQAEALACGERAVAALAAFDEKARYLREFPALLIQRKK